jgi:hypothetical protein
MAKALAKLVIGIAALAAATSFGTSPSHAFGDAPWCAVINTGQGDVYWDCQCPHSRRATTWVTYSRVIAAFAI